MNTFFPIVVKLAGRVIDGNCLLCEKTSSPREVTPSGMTTEVNLLHFVKADVPIVFTEAGILIDLIDVVSNALSPIACN